MNAKEVIASEGETIAHQTLDNPNFEFEVRRHSRHVP